VGGSKTCKLGRDERLWDSTISPRAVALREPKVLQPRGTLRIGYIGHDEARLKVL